MCTIKCDVMKIPISRNRFIAMGPGYLELGIDSFFFLNLSDGKNSNVHNYKDTTGN